MDAAIASRSDGLRRSRIDALLERLDVPASHWAFALRIWAATVLALLVAFWLQLESASSAAVCVAILAQPTRGQALSKAFYRILATFLGFAVSILFAALFGQDRVMLLVAFAAWLGACVFAVGYLEGFRAYGAMLSGYTVAIITVANIDSPDKVFQTGIDRVAAIMVGIVAVTLVNDALAAPDSYEAVRKGLIKARAATRAFVRRIAVGGSRPAEYIALVRRILAVGPDIQGVVPEFADGAARAAGARAAIAALLAQAASAESFARAAAASSGGAADALLRRVGDGLSGDRTALPEIDAAAQGALTTPCADPVSLLLHRRAADILQRGVEADKGLVALEGRAPPTLRIALPTVRDFPDALRCAARVVCAFAFSAMFLIATGWPAASGSLVIVSVLITLSAANPNPSAFATGVLIAVGPVVIVSGLVKFVVLAGSQGFPILAAAIGPVIVASCLLLQNPATAGLGVISLIFFPVALGPANPQSYNPVLFVDVAVTFLTAAILVFVSLNMVLPTSAAMRRRWAASGARASIARALTGEAGDRLQRMVRDAVRLLQFSALRPARMAPRPLRQAVSLAALDVAATGSQSALDRLDPVDVLARPVAAARAALALADPGAIRSAADDLLASAESVPAALRAALAEAVADLCEAGLLLGRERPLMRRLAPAGEPR